MGETRKLTLRCPDCRADLVVDAATGEILSHRAAKREAPSKDFDALLAGLDEEKAQAEELFTREVEALKDRDRLMDEKFDEALKRAKESPADEPPERPFDLD